MRMPVKSSLNYEKNAISDEDNKMEETVKKINLSIFPNPMVEVSTIQVSIENTSLTSIWLFDITGKQIANIIKEQVLDIGEYKFNLKKAELKEGIYIVQLFIEGEPVESRKLIVY